MRDAGTGGPPETDARRDATHRAGSRFRIGAWLASAFDPRGRLGRRAYQRLMLRLIIAAACILCAAVPLAAIGARASALALAAAFPVLALSVIIQTIRRFHDRGRTGWWLVPNLAIGLLSLAPIEAWTDRYPLPVLAYAIAANSYTLWCLVEAFGRSGTPDANRFGAAPGLEER